MTTTTDRQVVVTALEVFEGQKNGRTQSRATVVAGVARLLTKLTEEGKEIEFGKLIGFLELLASEAHSLRSLMSVLKVRAMADENKSLKAANKTLKAMTGMED